MRLQVSVESLIFVPLPGLMPPFVPVLLVMNRDRVIVTLVPVVTEVQLNVLASTVAPVGTEHDP
jgi:hypothetical protein